MGQNIILKACLNSLKTSNLFNIKQKFKINKLINYTNVISNRTTVRGICEGINLLKHLIKLNSDSYHIILNFSFIKKISVANKQISPTQALFIIDLTRVIISIVRPLLS